jgi:two-component system response regulator
MTAHGDVERGVNTTKSNPPKYVLMAEDNPPDVYLIRQAIQNAGGGLVFELIVTGDGEEAIDYILRRGKFRQASQPDLIILDLNLPKSDGMDVLRCVREQPELSQTPVIVLTSSDSPDDRSLAQRLGANRFVTKPTDLDAFMSIGRMLVRYLDGGGLEARSTAR